MCIIPIRLRDSGSGGAGCYTLPGELATDSSVNITVRVFENGSSADSYFSQDSAHDWYVVLHGGSASAYKTISSWPNGNGKVHQFEYDDDCDVLHYWNCDWSVTDPMICFETSN